MVTLSIVKTTVNGATVYKLGQSLITIGNQNANEVDELLVEDLPQDWSGMTVRAVFVPNGGTAVAMLLTDGSCQITADFTGKQGYVVVDAFNGDGYHAYTTACQYIVAGHPDISRTVDPTYTPTQVEQILAQAQTYANDAQDARDAAQGYAEDAAASAAEIEDMTVSASTLPAGSAATVTKTETQTGISLDFGIPRGADGQVQDVTIDGNSIVDADHVANIPKADYNVAGAVKINSAYGIYMRNDGAAAITLASDANIDSRTQSYKPIVPYNLDYAVKAAMTDGRGAAWTAQEQAAGRARLGMGNFALVDTYTVETAATNVEYTIPQGYTDYFFYCETPQGAAAYNFYWYIKNGDGTYKCWIVQRGVVTSSDGCKSCARILDNGGQLKLIGESWDGAITDGSVLTGASIMYNAKCELGLIPFADIAKLLLHTNSGTNLIPVGTVIKLYAR